MTTSQIVLLVIVIAIAVLVAGGLRAAAQRRQRTEALRRTFGPEYDRAVQGADNRRDAERELRQRRARHAELEIRPLAPERREHYQARWQGVQSHFVDAPNEALTDADRLVTELMHERGYPTDSVGEQAELLSVAHGAVLGGFRAGHTIEQDSAAGTAGTEQIRQAMLHFRTVFEELLQDQGGSRKVIRT